MNIGSYLALNARRHPEKMALTFNERQYSYEQFNKKVNQFANGLLKLGLKKGEKIALMLKNSDYFAISYFAAAKIGAVIVPVNFRLVTREVCYILDQSDSVIVVCDEELDQLVFEAKQKVSSIRQVITVLNPIVQEHLPFNDVLSLNENEPGVEVKGSDDLHIMYTSGTTGQPKGAVFDHERVVKIVIGVTGMLGLQPQDKFLHVAPLFHIAQLCIFLIPGFFLGTSHVIHQEFNPVEVAKSIEKERITLFFGVPTMYNYLLQVSDVKKYDFSSVKRCGYGAAPMAPELVKQSMDLFQTDQFYNLCGLTEGGPSGIYLTPEDHKIKLGKSGKNPLLFTEVKIVDEDGKDVPPGIVGEMILRGETIMKEYYKKPKETEKTFRNEWLYTGDLAVKDEDGYITLVDRSKDMVISGGENVYSIEVENVLYEHPDIQEVAVIGTPDPEWGEVVTSVIVSKLGKTISEKEIESFCRSRLAGYKIPRKVIFVDELPRNTSGKIQKYKLREQFRVKA
ncbi:long-chain-fatty-acid--CoA ligase [Bacillus sp. FJAT-47783]|uniref:long-chain-fatty-acid--CoA ligase n=1 Tax=Bacillus sp. FJAT-47783 TaxID=2922712 RepID=UPI001FAC3AB3|nr:long-chain-fatty-acid--CoA ligase [Bacillus sp. FJAT-47783]